MYPFIQVADNFADILADNIRNQFNIIASAL